MKYIATGTMETFSIEDKTSKAGTDYKTGYVVVNIVNQKIDFETGEHEDLPAAPTPFSVFGKQAEKVMALPFGCTVEVKFEITGREYNGKYYSELKASLVKMLDVAEDQKQIPGKLSADDIPF